MRRSISLPVVLIAGSLLSGCFLPYSLNQKAEAEAFYYRCMDSSINTDIEVRHSNCLNGKHMILSRTLADRLDSGGTGPTGQGPIHVIIIAPYSSKR